jgi:tetrahedral aminopeptidase
MTNPAVSDTGNALSVLLQKLTAVPGPSGYEGRIRDAIRAEVEPHVSSVMVDALGNLIAVKGTKKPNGLRIMLSAHMDEVGLIATHVDKRGYVRFTQMGAVYPFNCVAARVTFLNGVRGVINGDRSEDITKVRPLDQLYVDVGATSPEDCPVKVGDVGVFEGSFQAIGKRLISHALDNRVGCAILIELIRRISETPHELTCVFSTQEEVTIRGVTSAAYATDPDLGIAIDVTATGDIPGGKMEVGLGKGPAIKVRDEGMIADPRVVNQMRSAAEKAHLPHQMEILKAGTTDARVIQLARAGVPAGCLSIPARYIHSPSEMVDLDDMSNGLALLLELLRNPIELK